MSDVISKRGRGGLLVVGMLAAAMVGGLLSGLIARSTGPAVDSGSSVADGFFKAVNVNALATHSQEGMIMATGEMDSGLEAVYVLDALTGEIQGAVLNPQTRTFTGGFSYSNLMKDLGLEQIKNPKFVMVTGIAETRQGARGTKLGRSVIYVAELSSGSVAAYGAQYDPAKISSGTKFNYTLTPLDRFKFRQNVIRP